MKKRILGFLVLTCLVIGLLPAVALADTNTAKILILGTHELTVTEGGAPAYMKNVEFDAYNKDDGSTTFKAWGQEPGDAENWNVKFEYPAGGTPTVTLKEAKMDYFDNETSTYVYVKQGDNYVSTANRTTADLTDGGDGHTENNLIVSAIMPVKGCNIDLKVVLEGKSHIETGAGLVFGDVNIKKNATEAQSGILADQYFKNITISSVGTEMTYVRGDGIGIFSKSGYNLTFENAYIDIANSAKGSNACPIHAAKGTLTINGGHIKATNLNNVVIWNEGTNGNIIINGDVTVEGKLTSTSGVGAIYAKEGTVTVNGGKITGTGQNCPVMSAGKATIINGGELNLTSAYYALYASSTSEIQVNGGTIEIVAQRATNFPIFLGDGVKAVVGTSANKIQANYDGSSSNYTKPYMFLTNDASKLPEINDDSEDDSIIEDMGANNSTNSNANTTKPTSKPAVTPTIGADGSTEDGGNTMIIIIVAAVVVVAAAAVTVILITKKKKA